MTASAYPASASLDRYGPSPVLIAASSPAAARRAAETVEQAGYPAFSVPIEEAIARLDKQGAASACWIELDEDAGPSLTGCSIASMPRSGRGAFRRSFPRQGRSSIRSLPGFTNR